MCGHVGIAGKLEHKDENVMKRMLLFDYFRGPDSTGLAAIRANGDAKIAKVASHPIDLFDMKRFTDALNGFSSRAFIGHNRLATKGLVNGANAHPYHYDHIIGAHNGTLDPASWKALDEATGEKTDVDSQAIFLAIAKLGVEATIPMLQGAWALVWFDQMQGTLNFLRNGQRPFWYAYNKEFNHVFWASEWRTIDDSVHSGTGQHELFQDDKGFRYFTTKENWLYKFDLAKLVGGFSERPKPSVVELKGKEPAPVQSHVHGSMTPFPRPEAWKSNQTTHGATTSHSNTGPRLNGGNGSGNTASRKSVKDVIHLTGTTINPLGGYLDKEQFDAIAKYGCSWCTTDVEFEETGVVVFEEKQMVLCPTCAGTDVNQSRIYAEDFDKMAS